MQYGGKGGEALADVGGAVPPVSQRADRPSVVRSSLVRPLAGGGLVRKCCLRPGFGRCIAAVVVVCPSVDSLMLGMGFFVLSGLLVETIISCPSVDSLMSGMGFFFVLSCRTAATVNSCPSVDSLAKGMGFGFVLSCRMA